MKERPILFSGAMVRALLAGTKTQTRRVVKMKPHQQIEQRDDGTNWPWMYDSERDADAWLTCPYGKPGDWLWVRETWHDASSALHSCALYRADGGEIYGGKWAPSIHMPRWASRITLEITSVRVERLQDIDISAAQAEGVSDTGSLILDSAGNEQGGPIAEYAVLWEQINGPGSWDANPWVWVLEFRRIDVGHSQC